MDNYTIAAPVSVIGQVGFPAALVLFLLVKGYKIWLPGRGRA